LDPAYQEGGCKEGLFLKSHIDTLTTQGLMIIYFL
jgi:hypothetical protein